MMGRRSQAIRAFFFSLLFPFCCGPSVSGANADETPSALRIAIASLPRSFFPFGVRNPEIGYLRGFTGRSLTIYDKSWAVACSLCTELPTLENGGARVVQRADGSKGIDVTFDLDPVLAWDDGVPITTADILLGIEVAHKLGSGAAALPNILDAEAEDAHRVTFHIASMRYDYNHMEELFLLPAHLEKAIFDAASSPAEYRARSLYTTKPTAPGLSYGPYKLDQVSLNGIVLVKNPHWHGKTPNFDQILLRQYSDIALVGVDLYDKKLDMVTSETGLDLGEVYRIEAEDRKAIYNFIYKPTLAYDHIDVNLSNELLKDKNIRMALLVSLDRPIEIPGRERRTTGDAPHSFLPPTSPYYDPTLKPAPYDPAKAAALFDAAGFKRGADGIRVDGQGRRLAFRLSVQLDFDLNRKIVENIRDQWRQAGVEITLEDKRMVDILPHRQFDLAFYDWVNTPEFLAEPVYGKSGIPTAENNYRGLNFPGFDNDEMNKVVAALTTEMSPAKRLSLWSRAQQIYAEELPALPLAFVPQEYILPANMTGVEPTGHMIPTSYWVEDWKLH